MEGQLIDPLGQPIAGLVVLPVQRHYVQGEWRLVRGQSETVTDSAGRFQIASLAPGAYYLVARPGATASYYPGATNSAAALPVLVKSGEPATGVSWVVAQVPLRHVRGTVIDSSGTRANDATVSVVARRGLFPSDRQRTQTDDDGRFDVNGVADGDYVVQGVVARQDGGRQIGSTPLTVNGADVSDVPVIVGKPPIVAGRIVFDSAAPAERPWPGLLVTAIPLEGDQVDLPSGGRIEHDWTFRIESATGRSVIRVIGLPASWRLSAVRLAGRSVTDRGIDLRLNQEATSLEIELSRNVTTISGSVKATNQSRATDCHVVAFPQNSEQWAFGSRYLGTTRCNAKGVFVLNNLPPGDYFAAAVDEIEPGMHSDRNFLEWLLPRSTPFTVSDTKDASLHLALVHVP